MCHCIFFGINPRVSKHHAFRLYRATSWRSLTLWWLGKVTVSLLEATNIFNDLGLGTTALYRFPRSSLIKSARNVWVGGTVYSDAIKALKCHRRFSWRLFLVLIVPTAWCWFRLSLCVRDTPDRRNQEREATRHCEPIWSVIRNDNVVASP